MKCRVRVIVDSRLQQQQLSRLSLLSPQPHPPHLQGRAAREPRCVSARLKVSCTWQNFVSLLAVSMAARHNSTCQVMLHVNYCALPGGGGGGQVSHHNKGASVVCMLGYRLGCLSCNSHSSQEGLSHQNFTLTFQHKPQRELHGRLY
jgi:hypothetical protein